MVYSIASASLLHSLIFFFMTMLASMGGRAVSFGAEGSVLLRSADKRSRAIAREISRASPLR